MRKGDKDSIVYSVKHGRLIRTLTPCVVEARNETLLQHRGGFRFASRHVLSSYDREVAGNFDVHEELERVRAVRLAAGLDTA